MSVERELTARHNFTLTYYFFLQRTTCLKASRSSRRGVTAAALSRRPRHLNGRFWLTDALRQPLRLSLDIGQPRPKGAREIVRSNFCVPRKKEKKSRSVFYGGYSWRSSPEPSGLNGSPFKQVSVGLFLCVLNPPKRAGKKKPHKYGSNPQFRR